jgi:hypothetical protein
MPPYGLREAVTDARVFPAYVITTVTLAKGFTKLVRVARVSSRKPGQSRAAARKSNRGEITMIAGRLFATAVLSTLLTGTLLTGAAFAQVTGKTIQERKNDQQGRIAQGVRSGQLTAGETANLERREASLNREEHAIRRADGGHLNAQDKTALTRRQNNISRSIYKDKHNAAVR